MYILVKVEELVEKIRRAGWSLFQPMGVAPQTKGAPFMIIKNRKRFKISQKKLSNFETSNSCHFCTNANKSSQLFCFLLNLAY